MSVLDSLVYSDQCLDKPWGKYFVVAEESRRAFMDAFFPEEEEGNEVSTSMKILHILPRKQLSWQYHERRAEMWKVVQGKVGYKRSFLDSVPKETEHLSVEDDPVFIFPKERHRLIGLEEPCIVAETWVHVDEQDVSTEDDIVRLQDDFRRT